MSTVDQGSGGGAPAGPWRSLAALGVIAGLLAAFAAGWTLGAKSEGFKAAGSVAQISEERDALGSQIEALERERDELRQSVRKLEAEKKEQTTRLSSQAMGEIGALESERDQLLQRNRDLESQVADLEGRLRDAEYRLNSAR